MKLNVKTNFNYIGQCPPAPYEINGVKGVSYKVKFDFGDGVDTFKVDEKIYNSLAAVPPMTPVICDCVIFQSAKDSEGRCKASFTISGVTVAKK